MRRERVTPPNVMRVLHVIDSLEPGGTERQCLALAQGLSRLGVRNGLVYFRTGRLLAKLEPSAIDAREMAVGSIRSIRFPHQLIRLALVMRRWAPSVVQTYGFYSNLQGLLAATLAGVPVRVASRRDLGTYLRAGQHRLDRVAWRFAHRVVANSGAVRAQLIEQEHVPPSKVIVIRNGLDLSAWQDAQHDVGDPEDAVVGMVAHFRHQKDHVTFLKAAREILRVTPSVRFWLVGSGVLEEAIRRCAVDLGVASHVSFLGHLEGETLRTAVRRLTVSVLTSKDNEGLPNAVLESMAAGLPVVATSVGGAVEIIEDGVTGFLVPPGMPSAISERVLRLLKDPSLARSMGERGRAKVEREFTIDRMVGEFHALYQELLEQQSVRREKDTDVRRIVLAGYYPPPFGGESVHVRELARRLRGEGLNVDVINARLGAPPSPEYRSVTGRLGFIRALAEKVTPSTVLHLHTNGHSWKSWFMIGAAAAVCRLRRGRGVLTLHSGLAPGYLGRLGPLGRGAVRWGTGAFGHIICVNTEIRDALASLGVREGRLSVIPAYLGILPLAPLSALDAQLVEGYTPLVAAAGGPTPEYGLALLMAAVARLRLQLPRLGCVVMGCDGSGELRHLMESLRITDCVRCIGEVPHERFAAVVSRADVFVRPSYADGDAVSVREALDLGVAVVASDISFRPEGVVRFRPGDVDDLCRAVLYALGQGRGTPRTGAGRESLGAVLNIYEGL